MMKLTKILGILGVISAVTLLNACAPDPPPVSKSQHTSGPTPSSDPGTSVKDSSIDFVVTDVAAEDFDLPDMNTLPSADVKDGKILWTAAGSGSCPPVISKVTFENGSYNVEQKIYPNKACTRDYRVVQQLVSLKDGQPIPDEADIFIFVPDVENSPSED